MPARPAQPGLVGSRPWLQQLAVGFLPAKLAQAPWALYLGQLLQRRDKRRGQAQCQHQAAQLAAPAEQALPEEAGSKGHQRQHPQQDHPLLDPVMQDVFQPIAVAADELPGSGVEEQVGNVHVDRGQFQQDQAQRGRQG
ncbi:hypothetical protein D9M71_413880 [compost metagenome]